MRPETKEVQFCWYQRCPHHEQPEEPYAMAPRSNLVVLDPRLPDPLRAERVPSSAQPLRCLIVDDSHHFIEATTRLLESDGIAVVGAASNSTQAVALFGEFRPQITLVDIDLGEQSGFDVVEQLQRTGWARHGTVILTSTHSEQDFADMIAASSAVGFLNKADLSLTAICDLLAGHQISAREPRSATQPAWNRHSWRAPAT